MAAAAQARAAGMAGFRLRRGRPCDAPARAAIHRGAGAPAPRGRRASVDEAVVGWPRGVQPARHRVRVADAACLPTGYPGPDEAAGMILHLAVAPAWQGRGIGRALVAQARAAAPDGLALHAFQWNLAARRFYERQGFRAAEARPASANEEREPDLLYRLSPEPPDLIRGENA